MRVFLPPAPESPGYLLLERIRALSDRLRTEPPQTRQYQLLRIEILERSKAYRRYRGRERRHATTKVVIERRNADRPSHEVVREIIEAARDDDSAKSRSDRLVMSVAPARKVRRRKPAPVARRR